MEVNENVKKFIEENIELIENYDLGAIHVKSRTLDEPDIVHLYKILKDVEDAYTWLSNSSAVPYGFFDNEQVKTIIIPPNIQIISMYAIYGCDIDKIVCEESADKPLKIDGNSILCSSIQTFITKRDLLLNDVSPMMSRMDEFETHNDIIVVGASPFGRVYNHNDDIYFTVSKNSRLVYFNSKFPDESLAEHLINVGFKNVTVV